MLYAELGRLPLDIIIKTRTVGFWNTLILDKHTKIAYILYQLLKFGDNANYKWISNIKKIFTDVGRYDIWIKQNEVNEYSIKLLIKQILYDQFLQGWRSNLNNSSKEKKLESLNILLN